jgi:hypothetical protein
VVLAALVPVFSLIPPLDPGAAQARDLLERELAKPEYQSAKPNPLQSVAQAIVDWLNSITLGGHGGLAPLATTLIVIVAAAALVVAFLVFGLPRLNRRTTIVGSLFGEDDHRDAEQMRASARRAADAGDYATAIEEQFRAIARGLAEHGILTTFPGTTATGFARQAESRFGELREPLETAASSFNSVRYLDGLGSFEQWMQVAALDEHLRVSRPSRMVVPA